MVLRAPVFLFVPANLGPVAAMQGPENLLYGLFESRSGLERDPRAGFASALGNAAAVLRIAVVLEAPPLRGRDVEVQGVYVCIYVCQYFQLYIYMSFCSGMYMSGMYMSGMYMSG